MPTQPDVEAAAAYAEGRLIRELPAALQYHCPAHTTEDVVSAVERLAAAEQVDGRSRALLVTAAWFHDLGFVERADGHELIGARVAAAVLSPFGYGEHDIATVRGLILATTVPQRPATALEGILCDADLDVLGRDDFFDRNDALRAELAAAGRAMTALAWYRTQAAFVRSHRYFSAAARERNDARKAANLRELEQRADRAAAQAR